MLRLTAASLQFSRATRALALLLGTTSVATVSFAPLAAQLADTDNQIWSQNAFPGPGSGEFHHFGDALAICDFDGDGFNDLATSSPHSEFTIITTTENVGMVHVLYGGPGGLSDEDAQSLIQNDPVGGASGPSFAAPGNAFGEVLAAGRLRRRRTL